MFPERYYPSNRLAELSPGRRLASRKTAGDRNQCSKSAGFSDSGGHLIELRVTFRFTACK